MFNFSFFLFVFFSFARNEQQQQQQIPSVGPLIRQVQITYEHAEPLIDKYNQDLFERYELIKDSQYYFSNQSRQSKANANANANHSSSESTLSRSRSRSTTPTPFVGDETNQHHHHQHHTRFLNLPYHHQHHHHCHFFFCDDDDDADEDENESADADSDDYDAGADDHINDVDDDAVSAYDYDQHIINNNNAINNHYQQQQQQQQGAAMNTTTSKTTTSSKSASTRSSSSSSRHTATQQHQQSATSRSSNVAVSSAFVYPLSFMEAVNKRQLDMETGYFREPGQPLFTMPLSEAVLAGLLDPRSALVLAATSNPSNKSASATATHHHLSDAIRLGLITINNRVVVVDDATGLTSSVSLADALKTGRLKLGQGSSSSSAAPSQPAHTNKTTTQTATTSSTAAAASSSLSTETQSMSIRSILDAASGEHLPPTEAIKRKLLDPYKALYTHSTSGEQMAISEAIQRGYVTVEVIASSSSSSGGQPPRSSSASSSIGRGAGGASSSSQQASPPAANSSIISTSLIRETKSYHLLGVHDPLSGAEVSIKEAMQRGLLDRQRGLYVNPASGETHSISDAIAKGLIRAQVLDNNNNNNSNSKTTTSSSSTSSHRRHKLVSSNKFEENKSFVILGAVDTREPGRELSLGEAIARGLIDTKSGTYVCMATGERMSLNKAIDKRLVLVDQRSHSTGVSLFAFRVFVLLLAQLYM